MITRKIIISTLILVCCYNNLLANYETSIVDNEIEKIGVKDKAKGKYVINRNEQIWTIDTSIVIVKLKPEIKTLPEHYIPLFLREVAGFIRLKVPVNVSFFDFVEKLKSDADFFEIMEYSVIGKLEFTPNDPAATKDAGAQWHLEHIMAYDAWDYTSGDPNIIIAVLDGGLDVAHPDIANGTDGYNNMAIGGWNFGNNTSNVTDYNYHGTFVSGIISAKTNNLRGVAGIAGGNGATGSKVLPLKLVNYSATEIDFAVRYAVSQGVKVINMSFWTLQSPTIDAALQYAANNNVFLVKSAGNNQPNYTITYPGTHPEVFAVGATGTNKQRANFSSYGQKLNVVAPGENIYSTGLVSNGEYRYSSGTSFAAPIVSGIAALILSVNPDLTAKQVRDIIEQTAQKVGGYTYANFAAHPNGPWHEQMGYGLVNAYEAVKRAACTTCPYPYISLTGTQPPTSQTYKSVICNEITIQNATVPVGSTLILNACDKVTINPGFKVEAGASFTIR